MAKPHYGVNLYKDNIMAGRTMAQMIAPEVTESDSTLTPLDVSEEKSKDADDAIEYGMGLSQEELLDIVMSVTPMGSVKAGKGAISFLKALIGRAKSKRKFPVGYGQSTEDWMEVQKALEKMGTVKPKGMRQFGKFNRQKWEK